MNISDAPSLRESVSPSLDLSPLIARVEAATGPDRELDVLVWLAVVNPTETGLGGKTLAESVKLHPHILDQIADWWCASGIPTLTASLDATLALVERVLPGWGWCMRSYDEGAAVGLGFFANVFPGDPNVDRIFYDAKAVTAPLALCLALLRALQAQASESNGSSPKNAEPQQ